MIESLVGAMGEYPGVTSVLVQSAGRLEHEWYAERDGAQALRNTRSVTKTLTGMLVGAAIDLGRLGAVADPVASYLGTAGVGAPAHLAGVTIEDLLTMASCLDCDDADEASPGNEERMYPAPDWRAFAQSIPLRRPCGPRSFRYCTAHTVLLGAVLEAATGAELSAFADEAILSPLGVKERTWFRSDAGMAFPGGGLELRSRDLLALGSLYLDGGVAADGTRLVSAAWVRASTTPQVAVDATTSYGYLWWLRSEDSPLGRLEAWCMLGNGGNKVVVLPAAQLVVVITAVNYGQRGMHQLTDGLLRDRVLPGVLGS